MLVTEILTAEVAVEFCKIILKLSRRSFMRKSAAEKLISSISAFRKILDEVTHSGVELPQDRQVRLSNISDSLLKGHEMAVEVANSGRLNVIKNFRFSWKMEKLERMISKFVSYEVPMHILADVHHTRVEAAERFDQIDAAGKRLEERLAELKIGGGAWLGEAVRKAEQEHEIEFQNCGVAIEIGKREVKKMIMGTDLGFAEIFGMGGSGKTTLARELCRDSQILSYFNNRILFLTVSQSPNVEHLVETIGRHVCGNNFNVGYHVVPQQNSQYQWTNVDAKTLIVLDDVWTLDVLEQLLCKAPGCKTLVVSRFRFLTVFSQAQTYEVELLREDEALAVFCPSAFGTKAVPLHANESLVKQVVGECKGLPLALKVIGASLRDQPPLYWASAKSRLQRGEAIGESHQLKLLERMACSVKYLSKKVRECFLDLGAFPEDKKIPLDVLLNIWVEVHDLEEEEAFAVLVELCEKNLLTMVNDSRAGELYSSYFEISVTQHDVLRDLALHLSVQENINERKRLLMPRREAELPKEWERYSDQPFNAQIVSIHTGEMKDMEWFRMDFPKAEVLIINFSSTEYFLPPFISSMPKLRALILINNSISIATLRNKSVLKELSHLRSLWLERIYVPTLFETTVLLRNVRKICLVLCKIHFSPDSAVDLPSIFPKLSELTLDHCDDISRLPSSLSELFSLKSLSVTNCHSLQELPEDLGRLKALQILRIYACPGLKQLPSNMHELVCLKYLDISQCVNLQCLPDSIGRLTMLEKINMRGCLQIRHLPASVNNLQSLCTVVCDEDISLLWNDIDGGMLNLKVQVAKESFDLDWLLE